MWYALLWIYPWSNFHVSLCAKGIFSRCINVPCLRDWWAAWGHIKDHCKRSSACPPFPVKSGCIWVAFSRTTFAEVSSSAFSLLWSSHWHEASSPRNRSALLTREREWYDVSPWLLLKWLGAASLLFTVTTQKQWQKLEPPNLSISSNTKHWILLFWLAYHWVPEEPLQRPGSRTFDGLMVWIRLCPSRDWSIQLHGLPHAPYAEALLPWKLNAKSCWQEYPFLREHFSLETEKRYNTKF